MDDRPLNERDLIAERRLRKVLQTHIVANARTLEQKISDAGPNPMRVDPHVLTAARRRLERQGIISALKRGTMRWYHLSDADPGQLTNRLAELTPIYAELQRPDFLKRLGQSLEIAVYRALLQHPLLHTFGSFRDLESHDDSSLYVREEPPGTISGRSHQGRLDYIVSTQHGTFAGIEVKNVREWMYPDRAEIRDLLAKCTALDIVPVLVARRIPFVTFKLLSTCGAIVHQTYNQRFPLADTLLAEKARQKNLLGFHDIRTGNQPDARLLKFIGTNLPPLIESQRQIFDNFKDLLRDFATKAIEYEEFAARVRRRVAGTNEDGDWPDLR